MNSKKDQPWALIQWGILIQAVCSVWANPILGFLGLAKPLSVGSPKGRFGLLMISKVSTHDTVSALLFFFILKELQVESRSERQGNSTRTKGTERIVISARKKERGGMEKKFREVVFRSQDQREKVLNGGRGDRRREGWGNLLGFIQLASFAVHPLSFSLLKLPIETYWKILGRPLGSLIHSFRTSSRQRPSSAAQEVGGDSTFWPVCSSLHQLNLGW